MLLPSVIHEEPIQHAQTQDTSLISVTQTHIERSGQSRSVQLSMDQSSRLAMLMLTQPSSTKTVSSMLALVTQVVIANVFVPLLVLMLKNVTDMVSIFTGETKNFAQSNVMVADHTIHVSVLAPSHVITSTTGKELLPTVQTHVLKVALATTNMSCQMMVSIA